MLMFREEKSPEDEIKAWQFWHGRQHSVKQRILDAGQCNTKIYKFSVNRIKSVYTKIKRNRKDINALSNMHARSQEYLK